MTKKAVDFYLEYLDEQLSSKISNMGKTTGKYIGQGFRTNFIWSLLITPAIFVSWRSAGAIISGASRKCGIFGNSKGRTSCSCREKIKGYRKQIEILNGIKNKCNQTKDPQKCKDLIEIKIEKLENRLLIQEEKLRSIVGETTTESILPVIGSLGSLIMTGIIVDKAIFLSWRTASALWSESTRKCGIYKNTPQREICVSKYKLSALNKQLNILRSIFNSCGKQKNPEKCREKVEEKIKNLKIKIQKELDNISAAQKEQSENENS